MTVTVNQKKKSKIIDDGLIAWEIGPWGKKKHELISYYDKLFANSMKNKWDCRVYLDLFSSSGKSYIKGTNEIVKGSALLALETEPKFDKYIFCEKNKENLNALEKRVKKEHPEADCTFIYGDSNDNIENIINTVPKFSKSYKGLTFCFVDPYKSSELKFPTINRLANSLLIDFLILIPAFMDINRNEIKYTNSQKNKTIDLLLGTQNWRENRDDNKISLNFGQFIAVEFCNRMKSIGFKGTTDKDFILIRNDTDKNQPLYYLAFFSRHEKGIKFWRESIKNTDPQMSFNWD